jgi:hypothetical protein
MLAGEPAIPLLMGLLTAWNPPIIAFIGSSGHLALAA